MLGYMTKREAVANGFTHHGWYFGIPCWIAPESGFMVATKWAPFEYVMTAFHAIEQFLRLLFLPNEDPVCQFLVGPRIEQERD